MINAYEPSVCASLSTPMLGFSLQVFDQARPSRRVDCLDLMGNKRKVSFPMTPQALPVWESNSELATFETLARHSGVSRTWFQKPFDSRLIGKEGLMSIQQA